MPPTKTMIEERRQVALASGVSEFSSDFAYICKNKPKRIGIVAEGDSWFSYPRKWLLFGADINVVHHLVRKVANTNKVNLLRLSSNGDTAVNMTSGKQYQHLYETLKENREHLHFLMFSGGGNDIVGKNDMLPLLNHYESGFTALDCINLPRFKERQSAIILAYRKLIAMCGDIVPDLKIVTHTYDIPQPWNQGGEFYWGLIKTKPWIYPYLVQRGIPADLHLPIIKYMLEELRTSLLALAQEPSTDDRLIVVDTQGTLTPGSTTDWLNEIHPTSDGFKEIYHKIYAQMKQIEPSLP